jgi:nucleotide-binding universal stress UspA family protein
LCNLKQNICKMENLKTFQKILIAVDDTKYSYHAASYGFDLAIRLGAKVGLVHINEMPVAINITGEPLLGDTGMVLTDLIAIQNQKAHELFEKLKTDFDREMVIQEFILDGNITHEIVKVAKEFNASIIVMGTHGRTGFDHFISGSVAESVTRHAFCPVLIVPNKD